VEGFGVLGAMKRAGDLLGDLHFLPVSFVEGVTEQNLEVSGETELIIGVQIQTVEEAVNF
jgi:hypothetical protein